MVKANMEKAPKFRTFSTLAIALVGPKTTVGGENEDVVGDKDEDVVGDEDKNVVGEDEDAVGDEDDDGVYDEDDGGICICIGIGIGSGIGDDNKDGDDDDDYGSIQDYHENGIGDDDEGDELPGEPVELHYHYTRPRFSPSSRPSCSWRRK